MLLQKIKLGAEIHEKEWRLQLSIFYVCLNAAIFLEVIIAHLVRQLQNMVE